MSLRAPASLSTAGLMAILRVGRKTKPESGKLSILRIPRVGGRRDFVVVDEEISEIVVIVVVEVVVNNVVVEVVVAVVVGLSSSINAEAKLLTSPLFPF